MNQEILKAESNEVFNEYRGLLDRGEMNQQMEVIVLYRFPPIFSSSGPTFVALDSLLAYANMLDIMENKIGESQADGTDLIPIAFPVPIKFIKKYNVFASSFGFPIFQNKKCVKTDTGFFKLEDGFEKGERVEIPERKIFIRKFTDTNQFVTTHRDIATSKGKYRAMEEEYKTQILQGHAFYGFGNIEEVKRLFKIIGRKGVGKKTTMGFGDLIKVNISEIDQENIDEISIRVDGGTFLHKNIPKVLLDTKIKSPLLGYEGFKPSYWSHVAEVFRWGSKI